MKRQTFFWKKALHKLILWLETIENEEDIDRGMVSLFHHLHNVTQNCANLNNTDQVFLDFTNKHLFYDDEDDDHLPLPIYLCVKPSIGPKFIFNTLLSLGRLSTKRKIILNDTPRGWFCNTKLIGEENDPKSLKNYWNQVTIFSIIGLYFSNGQHMIDAVIIQAVNLLDIIIVNNKITFSEIPAVQLSYLLLEHDKVFE